MITRSKYTMYTIIYNLLSNEYGRDTAEQITYVDYYDFIGQQLREKSPYDIVVIVALKFEEDQQVNNGHELIYEEERMAKFAQITNTTN